MARLLTVPEVAKKLVLSTDKVYLMAQRGTLPSLRIDGSVRFDPSEIEDYLRNCRTVARPKAGAA